MARRVREIHNITDLRVYESKGFSVVVGGIKTVVADSRGNEYVANIDIDFMRNAVACWDEEFRKACERSRMAAS